MNCLKKMKIAKAKEMEEEKDAKLPYSKGGRSRR